MLFRFKEFIFLWLESHQLKIATGRRNLICTKPENVFTAAMLICDYYQFHVHEGELQPSIPTEKPFDGISSALRLGNPLSAPL